MSSSIVVTFEYSDKNNSVYISHNFKCHDKLIEQELVTRSIDYDKRCDYIEKQYLNNITHGICKYNALDRFKLFINELKEYGNIINCIPEDEDKFIEDKNSYIEIKLTDNFKLTDFIGSIIKHTYFNTFYNDNSEYWINYNIINNIHT